MSSRTWSFSRSWVLRLTQLSVLRAWRWTQTVIEEAITRIIARTTSTQTRIRRPRVGGPSVSR